jgi:hypothetical protein
MIRFNKGRLAIASVGLGVAVGSGGTAFLATGALTMAASCNRWRREMQYQDKMIKSQGIFHEIFQSEQLLIDEFMKVVSYIEESIKELSDALNHLPSLDIARQNLQMLKLNCPMLRSYVIKDVAPNAIGNIASYFIFEHPETSAKVAMAALPGAVDFVMSIGPENLINLYFEAFQIFAAFNVVFTLFHLKKAGEAAEEASKLVDATSVLMNKRKVCLQKLKALLPGLHKRV